MEQNANRRSRGETARSGEGNIGFPAADILSWMEAQFGEGIVENMYNLIIPIAV